MSNDELNDGGFDTSRTVYLWSCFSKN